MVIIKKQEIDKMNYFLDKKVLFFMCVVICTSYTSDSITMSRPLIDSSKIAQTIKIDGKEIEGTELGRLKINNPEEEFSPFSPDECKKDLGDAMEQGRKYYYNHETNRFFSAPLTIEEKINVYNETIIGKHIVERFVNSVKRLDIPISDFPIKRIFESDLKSDQMQKVLERIFYIDPSILPKNTSSGSIKGLHTDPLSIFSLIENTTMIKNPLKIFSDIISITRPLRFKDEENQYRPYFLEIYQITNQDQTDQDQTELKNTDQTEIEIKKKVVKTLFPYALSKNPFILMYVLSQIIYSATYTIDFETRNKNTKLTQKELLEKNMHYLSQFNKKIPFTILIDNFKINLKDKEISLSVSLKAGITKENQLYLCSIEPLIQECQIRENPEMELSGRPASSVISFHQSPSLINSSSVSPVINSAKHSCLEEELNIQDLELENSEKEDDNYFQKKRNKDDDKEY